MSQTSEERIQQQAQKLNELKDQLSRANAFFEAQKKALNLTDEDIRAAAEQPVPPALQALIDEAKEQAKRAGQSAAAQIQSESVTRSAPRAGRRRGLAI